MKVITTNLFNGNLNEEEGLTHRITSTIPDKGEQQEADKYTQDNEGDKLDTGEWRLTNDD